MGYSFLFSVWILVFSGIQANAFANFTVGGGQVISESTFPAVVEIFMGAGRCSASIVGPNVILTAAHCAHIYTSGFFYIGSRGYNFNFYTYKSVFNEYEDIAVGITDEIIEEVKPLTINFTENHSQKMISLGYGCAKELSESFVKFYEMRRDGAQRILITDEDHPVYACRGDSGGPTLAYTSDSKLEITGVHTNSDFNNYTYDKTTEHITVLNFIQNIVAEKNLKICGYNLECD